MDLQDFMDTATHTVISFDPMFPKYQNIETGRMLTSGWLTFDCGHAYQWHPHGVADDKSEPQAGDRDMCAICMQDALSTAAQQHRPDRCCFEFCELPATHKAGGEVYFPMCDAHWAQHCK